MPERYFIRAIKYFFYLLFLFTVIYGILLMFGQTKWETLVSVTKRNDIWLLGTVFIVLPLLYPFFGFITRTVRGRADSEENRTTVLKTAESSRLVLTSEIRNTMILRPATLTGRLRALFEDKITITFKDDKIIMTGPRKEIVRAEFRLKTFL